MGSISIRTPNNSDDEFKELLKRNMMKLIHERNGQDSLESFYRKEGINNAITTIRVSLGTKNKLKKYLKPGGTYEEVIKRLIENNEQLGEEISFLRSIEKENKNLIKYIESGFIREHKTLTYHPDLKIEYSYNESKSKSRDEFSFNLEIDNFLLQGKPIPEEKGIKTIQMINILKSLKNINLISDPKKIIRKKELMLESNEEYIRTKYLIYFKILFFIIHKKLDKKVNEISYLDLDFWKDLYGIKNLSNTSLDEDVIQKLRKFELELEQIKINKERRLWNINLKE
ncbi:MAG: hypothetical protein KKF74_05470 [Nanoarchaeota archaeon]|nr:hypothetical protein [Nanoarchaeota archaeon]